MNLEAKASKYLKQTVLDNPYIPITPTPKQAVFLTLPISEALYGGSAGGGKSVALLAAALQFVDVPNYRAMLLRRSYSDLNLPEALIPLSHAWLEGTDAQWNGRLNEWSFPSGATLTFGYLDTDADKYRYQGSALQFIGFDELTQFQEAQYQYLFSRLRRATDNGAPLRMRAATNPGGVGHEWVRRRFLDATDPARCFIPARLEDNPHLDGDAYDKALRQLDPVTRRQLRHGDWLAHADGLFPSDWFHYYRKTTDGYELNNRKIEPEDCSRFATVDVAGTEQRTATHDPDFTVIQVWDLAPTGDLLLVDQWRARVTTPEVESAILKFVAEHDIPWIGIESAGLGLAVVQSLRRRGLTIRALKASGNKIIRSQAAQIRMEAGTVYFPSEAKWLADLESELSLFPTGPHDDQVDALSYAARWAQRSAGPVPLAD